MSTGPYSEIYCLDADTLINIKRSYPEAIRKLSRYGKNGTVVIPEGVYREIHKKSDLLKQMVQIWKDKYGAVIPLNTRVLQSELRRIEVAYGDNIMIGKQLRRGFWSSKSGQRAADSQVVAVSKVKKFIAVSNDQAIQDACHIENVACITWQEFYRRMKRDFSAQDELFE